jgi:tetratricopeptide (TPR) repeat protein
MPLQDRAVNVLESLLGEPGLQSQPITFICHSLGGLIIKQVLLDLHQQKGRRAAAAALLDQVTQVVFLATPHTGSRRASLLDWLRFLAWPTSVARTLVANDPTLRAINVAYRGLSEERRETLRHRIFYEMHGTPAGVIVDEASSDPGLPGDPPIPIDADHIRIVKPIDRSALVYARTRDLISEQPAQRRRERAFAACQLPAIRTEQSWNVVPKLVRIAAIIVVTAIVWQIVRTTIGRDVGQQVSDAQKPLAEQLEKLAAEVAREKGVEIAPLRAILLKLGEAGVRDEDIAKRLDDKANELVKLRAEMARLRQGPAELGSFAQQAQVLVDKGDFDGARTALAAGRAAARVLREQSSRYEARFLAQEARVDHLQLAYRSAAAKYADAANLVAPLDRQQQWSFVLTQAEELARLGYEFGDNAALAEAIDVYANALLLAPRAQRPLDWASTQHDLGIALGRLGERESSSARLEQAVAAYREALKEWTLERRPLNWASTQNNLGMVLMFLGTRENGTEHLEEAVAAYREAQKEFTRERGRFNWATTQNNIGTALRNLGERESGTAKLEEALASYREALKEWTRERWPLQWAMAQNNLGTTLRDLGGT